MTLLWLISRSALALVRLTVCDRRVPCLLLPSTLDEPDDQAQECDGNHGGQSDDIDLGLQRVVDPEGQQLGDERLTWFVRHGQPDDRGGQLNAECYQGCQCQYECGDLRCSFAPFDAMMMQGAVHLTPFVAGWVYYYNNIYAFMCQLICRRRSRS